MINIPEDLPAEWMDRTWDTKDGPVDIGILERVAQALDRNPRTRNEIDELVNVPGPERVTKALGLLRDAGLVERVEDGWQVVERLAD